MKSLINPTDDELSAAVAEHVAGWKRIPADENWKEIWEGPDGQLELDGPWFATSADAVLPLLTAHTKRTNEQRGGEGDTWRIYAPADETDTWTVCPVWMHHDGAIEETGDAGHDKSLPRAACIALLRAKGIEVISK